MNSDEFEAKMRALERYHSLCVGADQYIIIRVDGRGFSGFTGEHFEKPFDQAFHTLMLETARTLLVDFQGLYAYTESDEISLLLPRTFTLFDREVEKLVSLSAATASAVFTNVSGHLVTFDSRLCCCSDEPTVADYFRWRQSDATRCALNGWSYWLLRKDGLSEWKATSLLDRQTASFKEALLAQHGMQFDALPAWQRFGVGLYWETCTKEGFNPQQRVAVLTERRRVKVEEDLPLKDAYTVFIAGLLQESA